MACRPFQKANRCMGNSFRCCLNLPAPKVRNATAWGNAPGNLPTNPEALKARNKTVLCRRLRAIPRLQRFDHNSAVNLGRWPRLLHHAPLVLNASNNLVDESVCFCRFNGYLARKTVKTVKGEIPSLRFTQRQTSEFSLQAVVLRNYAS